MGFWDWLTSLFEGEDESPPETLVLGAELRCQHGSRNSYLVVYSRDIDVNGLPGACVTDCIAQENIMPFGACRFGGPCEKYMDLDEKWENLGNQKTFINGKEIITTESTLTCRRMGGEIKADQSGQDGVMAKELLLLIEIEENYPGLLNILRDPNGNLYLNEGMCEKAIQFLEDCIRKHNGKLPASDVYEPTSLETYLMMLTMDKLIPGYDAANQATFTSAMEGIALSPGMDKVSEWDTHILNQEMIEALKVYCAKQTDKAKTNIFSWAAEKYKRPMRILGKSVQDTGYSLMLYALPTCFGKNTVTNGGNAYSIVAGNTLRTDLATLDSATLLAIQRRELLLNNVAGLIVTSNAATMSGNISQFALQNNLAAFNNMAESALKGGTGERLIPGMEGVVTGGDSTKLGKNMMESMGLPRGTNWTGHQAQHIIPAEMGNYPILQKIGMDLDDASNGLFLKTPADDISTMSRHRGYHSTYNEFVKTQLDAMDINQSVDVLQKQVYDLQQNLKYLQQNGLPLYSSQGATIDLWQRSLERIQ